MTDDNWWVAMFVLACIGFVAILVFALGMVLETRTISASDYELLQQAKELEPETGQVRDLNTWWMASCSIFDGHWECVQNSEAGCLEHSKCPVEDSNKGLICFTKCLKYGEQSCTKSVWVRDEGGN